MFSLQDYRKKKNEILANDRLSKKGKEDALAKLDRQYKDEARKSIKSLRKQAVETALKLRDAQNERMQKVKDAQAKIDYARLNYEAQAVRDAIMSSDNLSDVEVAFRQVKQAGNDYALKAWKDTSKALIKERFGGDDLYSDFSGELLNDIKSQEVDLAKVETSRDELEARNDLRLIENQANDINEAYGSGQSVINRVFEGIAFGDGKINLEFDYEINKLSDKSEMPFEVFNRIENEREKALDKYQSVLKEKGLDGVIDSDFDDLKDVL